MITFPEKKIERLKSENQKLKSENAKLSEKNKELLERMKDAEAKARHDTALARKMLADCSVIEKQWKKSIAAARDAQKRCDALCKEYRKLT